MHRTTVSLPNEVNYKLRAEAKRRGTSASQVVREALEEKFTAEDKPFSFIGIGKSVNRDLVGEGNDIASRYEEIMDQIRPAEYFEERRQYLKERGDGSS